MTLISAACTDNCIMLLEFNLLFTELTRYFFTPCGNPIILWVQKFHHWRHHDLQEWVSPLFNILIRYYNFDKCSVTYTPDTLPKLKYKVVRYVNIASFVLFLKKLWMKSSLSNPLAHSIWQASDACQCMKMVIVC